MTKSEALEKLVRLQEEKITKLEALVDELTENKWKKVAQQYGIEEEMFYGSPKNVPNL